MPSTASLTEPWQLGPLTVPNRVMLAPLAGIGNWFVRLQAKRYGAGMAVSEMVSSHAVHHGNRRTCEEMLRIDPRERGASPDGADGVGDAAGVGGDFGAGVVGGPVSIQLFGADPEVMRSAARRVAEAGADAIDLNMGCPVPKVCKTGAGAALLCDHARALAIARAAVRGSGLPVTVKLRSGRHPGDASGVELARRLAAERGVAAIAMHPRSAAVHHKGAPDYEMVARLVCELEVPVILTGGMRDRDGVLSAVARTGAAAVMLARGVLGNPWLFEMLLGRRDREPEAAEVVAELRWTIDAATQHMGAERATRWLRKVYPWYVARLQLQRLAARSLQERLQSAPALAAVDEVLAGVAEMDGIAVPGSVAGGRASALEPAVNAAAGALAGVS